ncbi:MAG TPA: exo-alpha-sialidase [Dermatophilaceae bacterium]|nr:exo-alpha-sialidase [Dermatophilaceae bacterium]
MRLPRPIPLLAAACSAALAVTLCSPSAAAATLDPTAPPGTFTEQNIAADRTAASLFYRIPALAHLGNGVVLASWDGRPGSSADAPNPNSIVQRRSTDNGATWGPMTTIAAGFGGDATTGKYGYSDPSYVVDATTGTVFCFFVYSKDAGFGSSSYGNDDADRSVISAAVVQSSDGGQTWSAPRLITSIVKPGADKANPQPGDVRTMFAASGEGIQLRYGAHAGRLIQQFSGMVRQSGGGEVFQAYSVYSDDHGATWTMGVPVGSGMDENKVVELSDGRVMLNSRDSAGSKLRKVAISTDGGHSYGPVTLDRQLPDPTNNGSITRLHPDAAAGSAAARKILFTNSNSQTARENVSARVSCDDGRTWPGLRLIKPGFAAYSTATRLADGQLGVFYEASYVNDLRVARFDDAWLNYVCAPLATPDLTMQAGSTVTMPVTVTNQEATALVGGTVTIEAPAGWSASSATVPDVAPGASVTVSLTVTAPATAAAPVRLPVVHTAADGRTSQYAVTVTPTGAVAVGLTITGTAPVRDVVASPYAAGERLGYTFRFTSTANVATDVVPTASSLELGTVPPTPPATGASCRWLNLPAGGAYNCTTPAHLLTQADIDRGWFSPSVTATITARSDATATKTVTFTGAPILLRDPATVPLSAAITGARADTGRDLATSPYAVGEQVPYTFRVTNTSPFTETVAPSAGPFTPLVPPGAGNCRWTNLPSGAAYSCATPRHAVTQAELDQGFFVADTMWTLTASGKSTVTVAVPGGEVDLKVREPDLDGTVAGVWQDVDGDRYASVGDQIVVTRTVGNSGNTTLTGLTATDASFPASDLALGASSLETTTRVLTQADLDAGSVTLPGFTATAANGSRTVSVTVPDRAFALDVKPAKPTTEPAVTRVDYDGLTSPIDLQLEQKYRAGQLVVAHNLPYGQWYYLYLNKTGERLGWFFPTLDDTVEVILPASVGNGADTLVVLDADGNRVAFGKLLVTPKGQR